MSTVVMSVKEVIAATPLTDGRKVSPGADPLSQNKGALIPQGHEVRGFKTA